jgi:DNA-binding response OmpR family regulator
VLTKAQLATSLGYDEAEIASNLLEVHMSHLRKKIDGGCAVPLLRTVRGRGYCLGEGTP